MLVSTYPELDTLNINKNKPIVICDADEVIFNFMESFEQYLLSENLYFNWSSYALEGNILNDKKEAIDKSQINLIINNFFKNRTVSLKLVKGAKIAFRYYQRLLLL